MPARATKRSRRIRRRFSRKYTNRRKRIQRGGALKEDALKALTDSGTKGLESFLFDSGKFVLNKEGNAYNNVIVGEYTFQKTRDMSRQYHLIAFKTSEPADIVTLHTVPDY
jgi:hypothetical protein